MKNLNCSLHRTKGFTLIELLVVMGIIGVLLGILLPQLGAARAATQKTVAGAKLKGLFEGLCVFSATERRNRFPIPGLIDKIGNVPVQGDDREDPALNSHANMWSAAIANNCFAPQDLVSNQEPSAQVFVMSQYNYDSVQPTAAADQYWDLNFKADLQTGSNVSFAANLLDSGQRKSNWRQTIVKEDASRWVQLGDRGVKDGSYSNGTGQFEYKQSRTLPMYNTPKVWDGWHVYGDGHSFFSDNFQPEGIRRVGSGSTEGPDNVFRKDDDNRDIWLTVCPTVTGSGTSLTFNLSWD